MNEYIKIKKKYLLAIFVTIVLACSIGIYYIWCAYHPTIIIQIGDSSTGNELIKMEAPKIAIAGKGIAEPAADVELKTINITTQHEYLTQYIRDNYKKADIKLDIEIQDGHTLLKYYGTVTNKNNKVEEYENIIDCDYVLDAKIVHE